MDSKSIQLVLMEAIGNKKPVNITSTKGGKYSGVVQAVSAYGKWTLQLLGMVKVVILRESEIAKVIWL